MADSPPVPAVAELQLEEVEVEGPSARRFKQVFPAQAVEGMLAATLAEIKGSLDALYEGVVTDEQKSAKATFFITWHHVNNAMFALELYSEAALRPKHADVRWAMRAMQDRMRDNNPNGEGEDFDLAIFAHDMVDFMTAYHVCLREDSSYKQRRAALEEFSGA